MTEIEFKKILKYVTVFVALCIIIYASNGVISVNAQTIKMSDSENSIFFSSLLTREQPGGSGLSLHLYKHGDLNNPIIFDSPQYEDSYYIGMFSSGICYEEYISTNSIGYHSYHFKYFYDVTDENNFSFYRFLQQNFSSMIYDYGLYTSISDDGTYSYDEFVILKTTGPLTPVDTILKDEYNLPDNCNYVFRYYSYFNPFLKIPDTSSYYLVYDSFITDDTNILPTSIADYTNSSGEYYSPEDLPYSEPTSEDNFITRMISDILNGIKNFGLGVWFKIKATFGYLFVPAEGFFSSAWDATVKLLEDNLGFLFFPFSIFEKVFNAFLNLGEGSGIIHIPELKDPFYSQTLVSAQDLNLKQIFSTGAIGTVHDVYLIVVDVIVIVGLISLCFKKFNSIFKGGQE